MFKNGWVISSFFGTSMPDDDPLDPYAPGYLDFIVVPVVEPFPFVDFVQGGNVGPINRDALVHKLKRLNEFID